ncbi:HigA family addiction module antitoxin [Rhodoblastus acidophilus]|uniref:HigA family addiction module antitoxin n=1 Tax=Rhodoblastus acidophilus TaxID=1074 RepID=UPI0022251F9D|nr:HigA family addiction module antitoxin [Rhodoblastus acidophilus]
MTRHADHAPPARQEARHPGALLREHVLPGLNLSVSQAARDLVVTRQTLHRILAGNAAITTEMALRLEKFCGVSSQFWLDRQHQYELQRTKSDLASVLSRIPSRQLVDTVVRKMGASDAD